MITGMILSSNIEKKINDDDKDTVSEEKSVVLDRDATVRDLLDKVGGGASNLYKKPYTSAFDAISDTIKIYTLNQSDIYKVI